MVLCEALWEGARRQAEPGDWMGKGGRGKIVVEGGARPSSARKVDTSSQKVLRL